MPNRHRLPIEEFGDIKSGLYKLRPEFNSRNRKAEWSQAVCNPAIQSPILGMVDGGEEFQLHRPIQKLIPKLWIIE